MNAIFYSFSFSFAFFNFKPVILKSFFYTVFKYNSIKQPLISYSVEHNWVRWHALRTQCAVSRSHELSSRPRLSDKIHVWFFLSLIHSVVLNNVFHFQHQYFIFFSIRLLCDFVQCSLNPLGVNIMSLAQNECVKPREFPPDSHWNCCFSISLNSFNTTNVQ